jgi:hypothetical protein
MVPQGGVEPPTCPLGGGRAIHCATGARRDYSLNRGRLNRLKRSTTHYKIGTESRNRTDTVSPPPDFESGASTSSAIPAYFVRPPVYQF